MRLPRVRFTIRRLMAVVAVMALVTWLGTGCYRWVMRSSVGPTPDPFDAPEMAPMSTARLPSAGRGLHLPSRSERPSSIAAGELSTRRAGGP
jgi:hypothetical protein